MKICYILTGVILLAGTACSTKNSSEGKLNEDISLEGSWEIKEIIDHDGGKTEWEEFATDLIYQKHITPTHFTWFGYDAENDILVGAGGGTYTLEGNVYVENIEFFHPVEDGYVGQSITFNAVLEGDAWYHKGSSPLVEFDPEIGEVVVFDTTYIEEKWVRIPGNTEYKNMLKTWNLISFRSDPEGTYDSYPDFVGYLKLLTSTHFVWIRYHNEQNGGEIIGLGSGTWSFDGETYVENIKLQHPPGSRQVGTTISFDHDYKDGKWHHFGYVRQLEEGIVSDSSLVDEIWISE